jgi:hypothetical protein
MLKLHAELLSDGSVEVLLLTTMLHPGVYVIVIYANVGAISQCRLKEDKLYDLVEAVTTSCRESRFSEEKKRLNYKAR